MREAEHFRQRIADAVAGCSGFWRAGLGLCDAATAEVLWYRSGTFGEGEEGVCESGGHLEGCG